MHSRRLRSSSEGSAGSRAARLGPLSGETRSPRGGSSLPPSTQAPPPSGDTPAPPTDTPLPRTIPDDAPASGIS
eukprot:8899682-Alexandrium_andersonii.AAC.1